MVHFLRISIVKGRRPIDHLINENAKRPPISAESLPFVHDNLWTHVVRGAHQGVGFLAWFQQFAQPIVRHLDATIDIEENVLRFEVSVHVAKFVQVIDSQEHLSSIEFGSVLVEPLGLAQVSEHLPSTVEIHDEEDLLSCLECEF